MKKILFIPLISSLLIGSWFFLVEGSEVPYFVDTELMQDRGTVDRYDLAQFLSFMGCRDCLQYDEITKKKYSSERWEDKKDTSWLFIEDIKPNDEVYQWNEYSYCVANAIDNNWMVGYPKTTSPFCAWRFCGSNTLTYGEFLQTIVAVVWDEIYKEKTLVWPELVSWVQDLWVVFDANTIDLINQKALECWFRSCQIEDQDEFNLYVRYCRHNLEACGMQESLWLKEKDYWVAYMNLLIEQWLLSKDESQELTRFDNLPSSLFLNVFDKIYEWTSCKWSEDIDFDWVDNWFDSCPYTYNPNQSDDDEDWLWNVCDDDIDGDWIYNAPWVIDDAWNIFFELIDETDDNCFVSPNDQSDVDKDWIGDLCDTDEKTLAWWSLNSLLPLERRTSWSLDIEATSSQWMTPLLVKFIPRSDRDIASIQRSFGDGNWSKKMTPEYTFYDSWVWVVRAVATFEDWTKAVAKQTIHTEQSTSSYIAFAWYPDISWWDAPLDVILKHTYDGDIDTVVWTIWNRQKAVQANEDYAHTFDDQWLYEVLAQAFRLDRLVATSRFMIDVIDEWETERWAYLQATPMTVNIWETINIVTSTQWFENDVIEKVTRKVNEEVLTDNWLELNQRFGNMWAKKIEQKIEFLDWFPPLFQEMVVFVRPNQEIKDNIFGANIELSKDLLQVWEEVLASLELSWWSIEQVSSITRDIAGKKLDGKELDERFTFDTSGTKRISANIISNENQLYVLEATINVVWNKMCLENKWICDLDNDWIIDMCDTDIDWDWVDNILGILIWENRWCEFTRSVLDIDRLQEQIWRIKKWEALDNCPFLENELQEDNDNDALWDWCDSDNFSQVEIIDTDKDGIIDEEDACPEIPENKNGIEDEDGCPEIWSWWWGWWWWGASASAWNSSAGWWWASAWSASSWWWDGFIKPDECIQCPCPKADYLSELMPWDRVKAVLVDPSEEIIYNHSAPRVIRELE